MKKLVFASLAILSCGLAYALPVGNPSEASLLCDGLFWEGSCCDRGDCCDPCASWCDAISFRFGYYGDFVFNRHFKRDSGQPRRNIDHTHIVTNAGYLALNFCDRVDIFGTLGATRLRLDTNAVVFNGEFDRGNRFELETDSHFSWSVGARGTIWECGCTSLGIEGQYFQFRPNIQRVTVGATDSAYPGDDSKFRFQEWQVGFGISHRINILVPYAAVKWSRARIGHIKEDDDVVFSFDPLKTRNGWGYAIGVSLVDCEKMALTAEGRWGDERALYINGQIRF